MDSYSGYLDGYFYGYPVLSVIPDLTCIVINTVIRLDMFTSGYPALTDIPDILRGFYLNIRLDRLFKISDLVINPVIGLILDPVLTAIPDIWMGFYMDIRLYRLFRISDLFSYKFSFQTWLRLEYPS